jgi:hypothetical protein
MNMADLRWKKVARNPRLAREGNAARLRFNPYFSMA